MGTSKRVGAMMIDSYPGNRMFCDGNIEVKLEMRSSGHPDDDVDQIPDRVSRWDLGSTVYLLLITCDRMSL
jgi:hypothetical protein